MRDELFAPVLVDGGLVFDQRSYAQSWIFEIQQLYRVAFGYPRNKSQVDVLKGFNDCLSQGLYFARPVESPAILYEVLSTVASSKEHIEDVDVLREHIEVSCQKFTVKAVNQTSRDFVVFSFGYLLGESGNYLEERRLEYLLKETSTASDSIAVV